MIARRVRKHVSAGAMLALLASLPAGADDTTLPISAGSQKCFESSDHVSLCYLTAGPQDATQPLLIFVPGWTMPASIWRKQLAHFAQSYPVVAFDPRGQGGSDAPPQGYTFDRRVADLSELLAQWPDRHIVLVGWSLGVLETLGYVREYQPRLLDGLVLVDNSIGEDPPPARGKGGGHFYSDLRTNRAEAAKQFATAMFHKPVDDALLNDVIASEMKMDVESSLRLLAYPKPRTYWREAVYAAHCPVLYAITPRWKAQADNLVKKHPQATSAVFEDSGHALFVDDAQRFNDVLGQFLTSIAGNSR